MGKSLNILVFATGAAKRLIKTIEERGHTYTLVHPSDVDLYLGSDHTNNKDRIFINGERLAKSKYDAVISRIGEHRDFASKALYHMQHNLNMFVTQTGRAIMLCADKWATAQTLSANKIQIPKQFYSLRAQYPAMMIQKLSGLPVIIKPNGGSKGNGVVYVDNAMTCNMLLESLYNGGSNKTIVQEYVNCGEAQSDERHIFVRGHGVVNSMRRHAPKDDVRANLSQNGKGEKIEADEKTKKFVTSICDALGLDFAGVDVMRVGQGEDEKLYCIEVNSNPGELIIDICDHNHYEELLQFVEDNCKKVNPVRADAMAAPTAPTAAHTMNNVNSDPYPVYNSFLTPEQNTQAREEWKKRHGIR